jgi:hypothetical protein
MRNLRNENERSKLIVVAKRNTHILLENLSVCMGCFFTIHATQWIMEKNGILLGEQIKSTVLLFRRI